MKKVLMSIKPQWVEKIFAGIKTIEVRRSAPKIDTPFEVLVYETKGATDTPWVDEDGHFIYKGRGQVIGSFVCDGIIDVYVPLSKQAAPLDKEIVERDACLSLSEIQKYAGNKMFLRGLHITEPKLFDKPKELSEFRKPCVDPYEYCQGCKYGIVIIPDDEMEYAFYHGGHYDRFETVCYNYVTRAPQSWQYVEEL